MKNGDKAPDYTLEKDWHDAGSHARRVLFLSADRRCAEKND
jgi:hypothetical protein